MPRTFNTTRAAAALVEAALKPDREVARGFGVGVRTIEYWRHRLKTDEALQREYRKMANEKLAQWITEIPEVLDGAIGFLKRATEIADPTDPKCIDAIVGALSTLNEIAIIHESLARKQP
jgi:transposase